MSDFDRAFDLMMESEGGYSDDKNDPGVAGLTCLNFAEIYTHQINVIKKS